MYDLGLEAFLAVVRTQNMSRAAAQLNLAQPTVSKRLQVLEQQIGVTLFERCHGVRLTPAGETFIDLAERWDTLKQQIENFHTTGPQLSLSIGITNSVISSIFAPLYDALSHHQPRMKLRVMTSRSANMYDDIEQRRVDVAISTVERTNSNVNVEECYTEPMVLLQPASKNEFQSELIHPQELNPDYELYVRWGGSAYQMWHDKWWDPLRWGHNRVAVALLLPALAQDHERWAIVPLSFAQTASKSGAFSIFRLAENPPKRFVYKLTHKNPKASTLQSLAILDHYLKLVLQNDFDLCFSPKNYPLFK